MEVASFTELILSNSQNSVPDKQILALLHFNAPVLYEEPEQYLLWLIGQWERHLQAWIPPRLVCFISSGSEFSSQWSYRGKTEITANRQSILIRALRPCSCTFLTFQMKMLRVFLLEAWREWRYFLSAYVFWRKTLWERTSHMASIYHCLDVLNLLPTDEICVLSCLDINVLSKEPK